MNMQGLFGLRFCLVSMCFLVSPAQVSEPAQCLVSGIYNLTRQPVDGGDVGQCWRDCYAEPDCHMAVMVVPLGGTNQCLLVNCLNRSRYSYSRHPSTEIQVYPKSTVNDDQRYYLMTDAYGRADETFHCSELMTCTSCQSGISRFFYNRTSFRCERFHSGCGSSRNSFESQEGCEALCSEKFRCYRPVQYGAGSSNTSMFFYNVTSRSCEEFNFSGRGSNGNIFHTEEDCEKLCGDIKAATTRRPAVKTDTTVAVPPKIPAATTRRPAVNTAATTSRPAENTVIIIVVCVAIPFVLLLVIVIIVRAVNQDQPSNRYTRLVHLS